MPELRWESAPACIDEVGFRSQLGALVNDLPTLPVSLNVSQAHTGDWTVTIGFDDVQRELTGNDCALLTDATALVVAVRTDAVAVAVATEAVYLQRPTRPMPREPNPGPTIPAPAPASRELVPESDPPEPGRHATLPHVVGGVAFGVDFGSLPRAGVAVAGDLGARWNRARIEAAGFAVLGPASRADAQGVRATFRVLSGVVRGCGVVAAEGWELPLCGGLEMGAIQARPFGLEQPNDVDAFWVAATAGPRLQRWFGRVAPVFFVDLSVPLLQHRFEVAGMSELHAVPTLVVRAGLGVRFRGRPK